MVTFLELVLFFVPDVNLWVVDRVSVVNEMLRFEQGVFVVLELIVPI